MPDALRTIMPTPTPRYIEEAGFRSRGIVRTRGFASEFPFSGSTAVEVEGKAETCWRSLTDLRALLDHIRTADLDGLPLTIAVEDPARPEAQAFLHQLRPLLDRGDTLWLLIHGPLKPQQEDCLNLEDPSERVFARNLVADLLFLHAKGRVNLEERLRGWRRRARAVFVACSSPSELPETDVGLPGARFLWLRPA